MKLNKKVFLGVGLSLSIAASALVFAPITLAKSDLTTVRGNVYNESNGGKGISGLTVTVSCVGKNNKTKTKTAITDGNGLYTVNFKEDKCEDFNPVTSKVTFNGQTQNETVYVSEQNTATLDFYFGSESVPEFSMLTGAMAVLGSAGAFLVLRKKGILSK